ncbi:MAG: hypothetical protein DRJ49_00840 [Thermoprotei archaeon]|nr:MAG: hypothetical protein DRJ49_00840 [Thermoprotei archaeon]
MKALILAAGRGSDLNPLTQVKPKHLLPILNKPIIVRLIEEVAKIGIKEVGVVVHYKKDLITNTIGTGKELGVEITYIDQRNTNGTAIAVYEARDFIKESPVLVLHGDITVDAEKISRVIKEYEREQHPIVLGVEVPPSEADLQTQPQIIFDEDRVLRKSSRVPIYMSRFVVNTGVYVLTPEVLKYLPKTPPTVKGKRELIKTLELMSMDRPVKVIVVEGGWWYNLNYPWDLLDANKHFLRSIETYIVGSVEQGVLIEGKIVLMEDSVIESGATIIGPVYIGRNVVIGSNTVIGPYTVICDDVKIGPLTFISGSLLMSRCIVNSHCSIFDTILGEEVYLESGVMIPATSITGDTIKVVVNDRIVDSRREHLGAIIADGAKIGANSSVSPGAVIEPKAIVPMGSRVSGIFRLRS